MMVETPKYHMSNIVIFTLLKYLGTVHHKFRFDTIFVSQFEWFQSLNPVI